LFARCSRMMMTITTLPQPVIARVHGIATAAGCQLVATCDLAVASSAATFATPGVNIGVLVGHGTVRLDAMRNDARAPGGAEMAAMKATVAEGLAAGALGLPGSGLRLITPPESGGSFGVKAAVYTYIVLLGLASRHLGVPVRWTEDRLEHLAAGSQATERRTGLEAAFAEDGELLALRYDAVEDVGAYLRAPEPATLYRMHGSLGGAYRVRNVAARNRLVLTNTLPSGLNRGFGGPQLYFGLERTMAIAASIKTRIPGNKYASASFVNGPQNFAIRNMSARAGVARKLSMPGCAFAR